ncbi:hypothetical protein ISF_06705 [Cordyceps fumosorosea ARSEF 2679]|uniref:Capsule polysaccharide biosynthesis protein n=1 Tax=Cordyceps fumosorosea (strain ARSEF 2679) TaxID=1081104 RepID=A0A167R0R2_CORFA|nr:hypothetical protein ISF_06705 [Cordyceps fumosorosea ARSEF 2679]OAA58166.1 hypothetical protein ISF_06705 [Cordyceps fumosorosea ARSEF 2679]
MSFKMMVRVGVPLVLGSTGYAASRVNWQKAVRAFLTGPGRSSRILLLIFVLFNMKNMPFVWTYRIFYPIIHHNLIRPAPELGPRALYRHVITRTRAPLLEIDYNLHKSNSTYFADLDASRTQLVAYLCRPGLARLASNPRHHVVLDPQTGRPARGALGIMLGSVSCSFRREIGAYRPYELWSRVLCWDRKWAYIVTHFVPAGAARPTEWLDPGFAGCRVRRGTDASGGWETRMHATAISKYVFKLGRLTVHPAVVLEASGLLPARPGGWTGGENGLGDEEVGLGNVDLEVDGEWTWQRVEASRRQGMKTARHVQELEALHGTFDGGTNGAIAVY